MGENEGTSSVMTAGQGPDFQPGVMVDAQASAEAIGDNGAFAPGFSQTDPVPKNGIGEVQELDSADVNPETLPKTAEQLSLEEQQIFQYLERLITDGTIPDNGLLQKLRDQQALGLQQVSATMQYRMAGEPEGVSHDASQVSYEVLQHLETLAADRSHPEAANYFKMRESIFVAKVVGKDGAEQYLRYDDYKRWREEGGSAGTTYSVVDKDVKYTEQQDPKEVRKNEIIKTMDDYVTHLKAFLEANNKGVQFCVNERYQAHIVSQINRYYPELAQGVEMSDEMLLRFHHRDNHRELYAIKRLMAEEHQKEEADQNSQLLEDLQSKAAFFNGEQVMLEGLDELKGKINITDLEDETRGLFSRDREEAGRFRQMREFVRTNSEKLKEYQKLYDDNIRKENIKGITKNSLLAIGFIAFLIGSQLLQGEGQPEPA